MYHDNIFFSYRDEQGSFIIESCSLTEYRIKWKNLFFLKNVILFQNSSILGIDIYNIMKCLSLQNKNFVIPDEFVFVFYYV